MGAMRLGEIVSQGAKRRGKGNPGSRGERPSNSTEYSRGHGRVQSVEYKQTSSKREGPSGDMYEVITGANKARFPFIAHT